MASKKKIRPVEEVHYIVKAIQSGLMADGLRHTVCGSYRRKCTSVGDIDIVINSSLVAVHSAITTALHKSEFDIEVLTKKEIDSKSKTLDLLVDGVLINLYSTASDNYGAMIMHLTGSATFNIIMRSKAKKLGLKLNQYGLWHGETLLAAKSEELVFQTLEMEFIQPEDRDIHGPSKLWGGKKI